MKVHELKTWPEEFKAVDNGIKTAEWRKNDRDYKVGDLLVLCEYEPSTMHYSGAEICVAVTHILHGGKFGIPDGHIIMSTEKIWKSP